MPIDSTPHLISTVAFSAVPRVKTTHYSLPKVVRHPRTPRWVHYISLGLALAQILHTPQGPTLGRSTKIYFSFSSNARRVCERQDYQKLTKLTFGSLEVSCNRPAYRPAQLM